MNKFGDFFALLIMKACMPSKE